jgi:hypothetical protein
LKFLQHKCKLEIEDQVAFACKYLPDGKVKFLYLSFEYCLQNTIIIAHQRSILNLSSTFGGEQYMFYNIRKIIFYYLKYAFCVKRIANSPLAT